MFSRMLDLRNMPFTVGRKLNWFTDIAPVADASLIALANITQGLFIYVISAVRYDKFPTMWHFD